MIAPSDLWIYAVLAPSIIIHEVSHGVAAKQCGDPTAERAGRLTLNPIRHVDPFGTVILPAMLVLSGARPFGWAKPVPVNPSRFRNRTRDSLLVSFAGPASNVALACLAAFLLLRQSLVSDSSGVYFNGGFWTERLIELFQVSVVLAPFTSLPIPPLDGSAVIEPFVPRDRLSQWYRLRQYGLGIVLMLTLVAPTLLGRYLDAALRLAIRVLF